MSHRTGSLSTRLLVTTSILLVVSFAILIGLLDAVFRQTSEEAIHELLHLQVLALIGAAEPQEDGSLVFPDRLPEPRLGVLGSGLYAEVIGADGQRLWRSPSALGISLSQGPPSYVGDSRLTKVRLGDDIEALVLGVGILWEVAPGVNYRYQFLVAENLDAYSRQLEQFRKRLFGWFAGVMLALVVGIAALLRWSLSPLRRLAAEIAAVERGEQGSLGENYPRELVGVTRNLNALIDSERQRMARYRTTMDDLAHSIKTPLAVLSSELQSAHADHDILEKQVSRMHALIDYQLRRAAATGPRTLAATLVALAPVAREVAGSLRKIYQEKDVDVRIDIAGSEKYPLEKGDLYELLGNLMDNAWKWCAHRIDVAVTRVSESGADWLVLTVADDGPGISDDQAGKVFGRGERSDQRGDIDGQGIGLAVVEEIVGLYGGSVAIGRSGLGGAVLEVRLPVR